MSKENIEVVRRIYDASARRDADAVLGFYDPDVEWHSARAPLGALIGGTVYRGHDGVRSWFRQYAEAFERVEDTLKEVLAAGDHVISVATARGRGWTSGLDFESRYGTVWKFRGGKVVRVEMLATREEALKAAGFADAG